MTDINHAATGTQATHDFSFEPGAPQPDAFVEMDRKPRLKSRESVVIVHDEASPSDRRDLYEYDGFESDLVCAPRILGLLALIAIGAWALHGISGFLGAVLP